MLKFIRKSNPKAVAYIDLAIEHHLSVYGIRPGIEQCRDVVTTEAMDLIGRLCTLKEREISTLRKEQIHSVQRSSVLLAPPDINDLV